jgi:O-antigen/teichoic acid export membrane protein
VDQAVSTPVTPGGGAPRGVSALTRRTARNAAVRGIAEIIGKFATLAWTLVAGRELSTADFGAFAYALGLSLLVSSLPAWGFDIVLARRASAEPKHVNRLHSEAIAWQTLLAVPVLGLTALVAGPFRPSRDAVLALLILLVAALLEIWSDTARATAAAKQRQSGIATALLVQRCGTAVLAIAALLSGGGILWLSLAFLAGTVIGYAAHLRALRVLDVHFSRALLTRDGMADMGRRSRAVGLSALILMALFRVDVVILEAFKGDAEVAAYAVAYRLLETVLFVTWAVNHAVFPVMSASTEPSALRRGVERGTSAAAFIYLPFAAVSLAEAPAIIRLLYGSRYVDPSATVLRWLALAPMIYAVAYLGVSALVSRDRTRAMVVAASVALLANVALNVALIPSLGGVGAAVATTLSYAVELVVVLVVLRRLAGVVRLVSAVRVPLVASALVAGLLVASPLPLLVDLALAGALYLVVWWALARRFAPEQLGVLASLVPGKPKAAT